MHRIGKDVTPQLVVILVDEMKKELPVRMICHVLGVAKSIYYRWKKAILWITFDEEGNPC